MRISKSVLINSLAALVLVATGYLLGQAFPANTAAANSNYSQTKITGTLKMRQGDQVMVFADGAQRLAYCGFYTGCTGGGVTIKINKMVNKTTGNIQYSVGD